MTDRELQAQKEKFTSIYRSKIHREGADKLLEWLCSEQSDFFLAPASTRYHGAENGGLCRHSLNVYECLVDILAVGVSGKAIVASVDVDSHVRCHFRLALRQPCVCGAKLRTNSETAKKIDKKRRMTA